METKIFARAEVKEVKEDGTIIGAVASTGSLDRDEEKLEVDGWILDNFKKNPVLLWSHDARQLPIGKVTDIRTNEHGELVFDAIFARKENDFAKKVADLMSGGFLNSFSVGFNPLEKEDNTFKKQELLEISVVNVPANPDARVSREFKELQEMEKDLEKTEEKVEETEEAIRIPIRACSVTATIDISKQRGIKALYCGDVNKIRTYIFDKSKGWTVNSAQKWVKEHDDGKTQILLVEKEVKPKGLPEDTRNLLRLVRDSSNELLSNTKAIQKGKNIQKVEPRIAEKDKIQKALRLSQKAIEHAAHCLKENKWKK